MSIRLVGNVPRTIVYIGGALAVYDQRGLDKLYQITLIPVTDDLSVVAIALVVGSLAWVYDRLAKERNQLEHRAVL